ncbi:DinB family protein [Deinococcus taeanensis]|uniref:DinB family protein n=1 Tax=Deinococcus taeanensis TaxID=2737050 RepID=UPI001CDD296F|nr:DinB family protein [Deinococcus taeanensis]UBV42933.1 DinB family protein [Deinococcus taeanensis]
MNFQLAEGTQLLARTPGVLSALLRGLPDTWVQQTEGEGTWSPADVVAHLAHAERTNWLPRARVLLECGERVVFPPFDRFAHLTASRERPLAALLDDFAAARTASLQALGALRLEPADLARRGTHPEFGTVTLEQLLATWVTHDLDHLAQVTRTLAGGLRGAVGPWEAYLRVLRA